MSGLRNGSDHPDREQVSNVGRRHRLGRYWLAAFMGLTTVAIVVLGALLYTISNDSVGLVAFETQVNPATILPPGATSVETLREDQLLGTLAENLSANELKALHAQEPLTERSQANLVYLVNERVLGRSVADSWSLAASLLDRSAIEAEVARKHPGATLRFHPWVNLHFLTAPQSSNALYAGIRTAILGSLWMITLTMLIAVPIGVGAGVYLEEYANRERRIIHLIQTNINNLAAVPSIIYGMLGLAVFVRALEPITSGAVFGATDGTTASGRTILSAALTMALLILPLIIVNAQEAIRAVPSSLRDASYGVGATKWQTVRAHVLPNALGGILTGTILSMSRALGETAPLLVVGVSTYVTVDPTGPFSKYTVLPAQIYQWTSRPQAEFRNIAAAASVALLLLLLLLNASVIYLRRRSKVRH